MRRISNITKEAFAWCRVQIVQGNERLEHWEETMGSQACSELREIHESLVSGFEESLGKLVAMEVSELTRAFGLTEKDLLKKGSAFPHLNVDGVDLDESIVQYAAELVEDNTELHSIPAVAIADEFEEWLNDLYEWHLANSQG